MDTDLCYIPIDDSLPIDGFNHEQKLSMGAFSSVYLSSLKKFPQCKVAIKEIFVQNANTNQLAKSHLIKEVNAIKSFSNNFIAQLFDIVETKDHVYLILEYVENGSILQHLNQSGPFEGKSVQLLISQIINILFFLHNEKHIIHRDIKAENVLLDRFGNIKIVDFGLCNHFTHADQEFTSVCGSIQYLAPEIIQNRPYTKAVDIWSAGVLIYFIVVGQLPFEDISMHHLLKKILHTNPQYPSSLDPNLVNLLKRMLCKDPNERITAAQLKEHPYFQNFDFNLLPLSPCEVSENEIIQYAKSKGIDAYCNNTWTEFESKLIRNIIKKQIQNEKLIMMVQNIPFLLKPSIRNKHSSSGPNECKFHQSKYVVSSHKKRPISFQSDDPMKMLAIQFANGEIRHKNAVISLSDPNYREDSLTKFKQEMST